MDTFPRISIITPSFNQGQYLEKAILSVLNQCYHNLEYIIIDGGSTDNSVEIIKKYESKISYWISEKDGGQSEALNKGLRMISGDIVAWLNSDDWYEEGAFDAIVQEHRRNRDAILVGNCTRYYVSNGRSWLLKPKQPTFGSLLRYWRKSFCPAQPSIFFPSAVLHEVGLLDESLHYAMDLDLWIRMAKNHRFHLIDKNLSNYLIHSESKSGSGNGFDKFRPEWRAVCLGHLKSASWLQKISFYADYYYHWIFKRHRLKI